jgi:hypothetical protein
MWFHRKAEPWFGRGIKLLMFSLVMYFFARFFLRTVSRERKRRGSGAGTDTPSGART